MFIIEKPQILYLLLLLIPMAAGFYWNIIRKRRCLARLGNDQNRMLQIPEYSVGKQHVKFILIAMTYALLIFALSNPQMGTSVQKAERKGIDVMIALDISNSMNCNDIQPSRLMRAKQSVLRIIDKMESDRIGLVIFAGDAYLQLPLTTDYSAAKLFISNVETSDLSRQGTAIGTAIQLCMQNFDPKLENTHNKAIIVISDGENHEDDAVEAARDAAHKGITVYTVGMGSVQGAPIPILRNGQVISYKKDVDGNVVVTKLNREMLQEIAQAGKGSYVEANNISSGVETIFEKLSQLDKASFQSQNISDYETRYQYFIALAIILLILEIFIYEKRNKVINRVNLFGMKENRKKQKLASWIPLLAILGISLSSNLSAPAQAQVAIPTQKGNRYFQDSSFQKAEEMYSKALLSDSNYAKARYNLGNSQYKQGNYTGAISQYERLKQTSASRWDKKERSNLLHNLGNAYVQQKEYEKAIENYVASLKEEPGRNDTRYNLAYARKMLKKQQDQQQNQQDQQQQKQKDQQKNQQQDQQQKDQQQEQQQKDQQKKDQQQNQQNQQNQQDRQKDQQQQAQKAKKQEAERILKALENQEKNTLDKIKKNQNKDTGSPIEKDW